MICVIVYGVRLRIYMFFCYFFRSLLFFQLKNFCLIVFVIKFDRKYRVSIDFFCFFVLWQVLKIIGLLFDINMDYFIEWEFEFNFKVVVSKIQFCIIVVVIFLLVVVISCNY